jgi:hypothetical protein
MGFAVRRLDGSSYIVSDQNALTGGNCPGRKPEGVAMDPGIELLPLGIDRVNRVHRIR